MIVEDVAHRRLPILDIRAIFTDSCEHVNAIEPSIEGGRKLADAVVGLASKPGSAPHKGSLMVG